MFKRLGRKASCVAQHSLRRISTPSEVLSAVGLSATETIEGSWTGHKWEGSGADTVSISPNTGESIATIRSGTLEDYRKCLASMDAAKRDWGTVPAPVRGKVVAKIAQKLAENKDAIGALISLEVGKIVAEGKGEVQEAIDICEYASGLSRNLSGKVLPSERPGHFMLENWNPLNGHLGVITSFNFPCAPYFWNVALSLICGNAHIWKGSNATPLVTLACHKVVVEALAECGHDTGIATTINGRGSVLGKAMSSDKRIELLSFTGSTQVGIEVNIECAKRFGKVIMECGGNNGAVVMEDADLDIALNAVLFGAVGTAGQRCTSLRRLFVQESVYDEFVSKLMRKYKSVKVGDPFEEGTLCGPLISASARQDYADGIERVKKCSKSRLLHGGAIFEDRPGFYVEPAIAELETGAYFDDKCAFVREELFGPLLYVFSFKDFDEAMHLHNEGSMHGLSSSLFTNDMQRVFQWLGPNGSDCGLANVNIGTSGAEIGGAFGGEKLTGLGRESGSDSWKQYMRRSTCTVNYSSHLPLAQGIVFGDE